MSQPTEIVIRKFDEQKLEEEVIELINKRDLEKYKNGYVGFFSYSDAPAAIGGGSGHFLWFDSYHNLYQFLADYFVVLGPGRYDLDHEKVYKNVGEIIKQLAAGKISTKKAIQEINKAGKHFSQIEWIGELEDLTEGNSEFAKKTREFFYEKKEEPVQNKIIKKDLPVFVKSIGEYGI